jgi:hypothetical protein
MQPNDLPLVCLPLELSDDAAATLIDFLHELIESLERHYAGQLIRRNHLLNPSSPPIQCANIDNPDPPF